MQTSKFFLCAELFLLIVFLPSLAFAQTEGVLTLTAKNLQDGKSLELHKLTWKYRAGDDSAWAAPAFDDLNWKSLTNDEINSDPARALEN